MHRICNIQRKQPVNFAKKKSKHTIIQIAQSYMELNDEKLSLKSACSFIYRYERVDDSIFNSKWPQKFTCC